jgi:hypothetical protein
MLLFRPLALRSSCLELAPDRDDYRAEYAALLAEAGRVHEARQQMDLARGIPAADEAGGSQKKSSSSTNKRRAS